MTEILAGGDTPEIPDMTGADATTAGEHGLVPAPEAGDNTKYLRGDGIWAEAGEKQIVITSLPYTFTEEEWAQINKPGGWFIRSQLWPNDMMNSIYLYSQSSGSYVTFTALKPYNQYISNTTPCYTITKIRVNSNTRTTDNYPTTETIPVGPSMPSGDGQWVLSNKHENGINYNLFWQPFKEVEANPETTTETLTGITIGDTSYEIPSGGGSSYTFTNGLTESDGTVSWDLNDRIYANGTKSLIIAPESVSKNRNISIFGGILDTMPDMGGNICIGSNNRIGWDGNSSACLSFMTGGSTHRNSGIGNISIGGSGKLDTNYTSAIGYGIKQTTTKRTNYLFKNIFGNFNIDDTTDQYQFIIGNGTSDSSRSNAFTVAWNGNTSTSGDLYTHSNIKVIPQTLNATETTPTLEGSINWTYE